MSPDLQRFRPYCADADFLVGAAFAAGTGAVIVTYDLDDLAAARALGIEVIRPADLLRRLEE